VRTMFCRVYQDEDGDIVVEASGEWEGCVSHGATLSEALGHFAEAAALYAEVKWERPTR